MNIRFSDGLRKTHGADTIAIVEAESENFAAKYDARGILLISK